MAWQLIFTSAPRGLALGRSGFCTVARHEEIRESLATEIERISSYHHIAQTSRELPNPVISAHRIIVQRDSTFHVLSKIRNCGVDYTSRTNHIAHHLIFTHEEIASAPSPAHILMHWNGWLKEWKDDPRFLTKREIFDPSSIPVSPLKKAVAWESATGDAENAALLIDSRGRAGCYVLSQPGKEESLLPLFDEALQLLQSNTSRPLGWQIPFTTFIQTTDSPNDFRWKGSWPQSESFLNACKLGAPFSLDISNPHSLPKPDESLALSARNGTPLPNLDLDDIEPPLEKTSQDEEPPTPREPAKLIPRTNSPLVTRDAIRENIKPFPEGISKRTLAKPLIAIAVVLAVIAVATGYWLTSKIVDLSRTTTKAPSSQTTTEQNSNFPTTLPSPSTTASKEPQPLPPLPPKDESPAPSPLPAFTTANADVMDGADSSGLPKRKTLLLIGSLDGQGITITSESDVALVKSVLQKTDTARLWRIPNSFHVTPQSYETLEQRIPGTTERKPGFFYNSSAKQLLTISSTQESITFQSQELSEGILALLPQNSDSWQIAVFNKDEIGKKTPLIVPTGKLELKIDGDNLVLAIKQDFWTEFLARIRFPQFATSSTTHAKWRLRVPGLLDSSSVQPAFLLASPTAPSLILGPIRTRNDALKIKQEQSTILADIQRQLESKSDSSRAADLLFDPYSPLYNIGARIIVKTPDMIQREIVQYQNALSQTSTGKDDRRIKSIYMARIEQLQSARNLQTFETYLSSLVPKVAPANATLTHYSNYLIAILKSAEPAPGWCIGTDGSTENAANTIINFKWDEAPNSFSRVTTPEDNAKRVQQIANVWKSTFTPETMAILKPVIDRLKADPNNPTYFSEVVKLKAAASESTRQFGNANDTLRRFPSSVDELPVITLEWQSSAEPYSIITFQREAP